MTSLQLVRWQRWIVLAHIALAFVYGAVVPPWEAHDEIGHFAYIHQLVTVHSLPDAMSNAKVFLDQSHQPPLYYLTIAALTFWAVPTQAVVPQINYFAFDGTNRRGTRIAIRERSEDFPWTGTVLALHLARLVSGLLSGAGMILLAGTARLLFADRPKAALLVTAIAAFNPQLLFMAGMINNDIMITLMGAALAYLIVRIASMPPVDLSSLSTRRRYFILGSLGVALALSLLSKNSGFIFVPFTALALLYIGWRQHWSLRFFVVSAGLVGIPVLVIAAPYYAANCIRYGVCLIDRSPNNPILGSPASVIGAGFLVSLRDGWLPQLFVNTFRTFWGTFGWGNIQMADTIYTLIAILTLFGLAGCAIGLVRQKDALLRGKLVILIWMGLAMMLLPGYRAIYFQSPALMPGRYLMPAMTAYASMLGFGWYTIFVVVRRKVRILAWTAREARNAVVAIPCGMAIFALAVPFLYIAPAYAPPLVTTSKTKTPVLLDFEGVAQVISVDATTTYLDDREGQRHYAKVHLEWRVLKATPINYAFGISVLGGDDEVLGNINILPAHGNYPSTNWNAGDNFTDEYYILLEKPCAHLPTLGRVSVSMYEYTTDDTASGSSTISITHQLQARDGKGRPVSPIVGRFRIDAPPVPMPVFWQQPKGMLDGIALVRTEMPPTIQPGSTMVISLTYETWRGDNPPGIAFVHLFDTNGDKLAQDDHPPASNGYPTDLWIPGECIDATFSLQVPMTVTGNLHVLTGMYSSLDNTRFKTGTPDDLISIGSVAVKP